MTTIASVKQAFVEKRRFFRYRANCQARIEFDDLTPPRPCTILDISGGGARIAVTSPRDLPLEFSLVISGLNITRRTRIVWRSDDEIGVSYVGIGNPDQGRRKRNKSPN